MQYIYILQKLKKVSYSLHLEIKALTTKDNRRRQMLRFFRCSASVSHDIKTYIYMKWMQFTINETN